MRYVCAVALIGILVLGVAGCKTQKAPETVVEDKGFAPEPVVSVKPPEGNTVRTDTGLGWGSGPDLGPTRDVTVTPPLPPVPTPVGQSYTVQKGDTLFSLARRFYNDQAKWKVIYEANRVSIPNANVIRIGQVLTIPAAN